MSQNPGQRNRPCRFGNDLRPPDEHLYGFADVGFIHQPDVVDVLPDNLDAELPRLADRYAVGDGLSFRHGSALALADRFSH